MKKNIFVSNIINYKSNFWIMILQNNIFFLFVDFKIAQTSQRNNLNFHSFFNHFILFLP